MAPLLRKESDEDDYRPSPVVSLVVEGVSYSNAAAKFWVALLDEIATDHPICSLVELIASDATELNPEQLFPEIELEREIANLSVVDIEKEIQRTMAQLELIGPPSSVEIALYTDNQEILRSVLPEECVDAEIFPYLLVWLLEWAGLPSTVWNAASVKGEIRATDRTRNRHYHIGLELQNRHLAEGLYRRILRLWPRFAEGS